jgi:hypothetical protein
MPGDWRVCGRMKDRPARIVARSRTMQARRIMTIPIVPADSAAPSEALAQSITAPVPTGAMPAIVVPAVLLSAEDELRFLNDAKTSSGCT